MVLFIVLLFLLTVTVYSFRGFLKSLNIPVRKLLWGYGWAVVVFVAGVLAIWYRQVVNYSNVSGVLNILISVAFVIFLILLFAFCCFIIDDLKRVLEWCVLSISQKRFARYPKRSNLAGFVAVLLSGVVVLLVMYGALFGITHYKVHRITFEHEDVPSSFDGFKIAQISDMHLGTFAHVSQIEKGLKKLQHEQPDLIVFTGDMVNNLSSEAEPYVEIINSLKAAYGKFAILGNHDYAHYAGDLSPQEREEDVNRLRVHLANMGFDLLENESTTIHRNSDSIFIAGVENWGIAPFPQYGDLDKALAGVDSSGFIILLSHDPSHWTEKVIDFPRNVALTLSGHTHGMQFGIELVGFKWSPVQYRYRNWAGMHSSKGRSLYVNRGFGSIGFPGRVGVRPEITIIELKSTSF